MRHGRLIIFSCLAVLALLSTNRRSSAGMWDWMQPAPAASPTDSLGRSNGCPEGFCEFRLRHCRSMCKQTYYPAVPFYCAPNYGYYSTCWRKLPDDNRCPVTIPASQTAQPANNSTPYLDKLEDDLNPPPAVPGNQNPSR